VAELAGAKVLVIGGAGFIGSHVVDLLLQAPVARVRVFDNFVRGTRRNIAAAAADDRLQVVTGTTLDRPALAAAMDGSDLVVHLASVWLGECFDDPHRAVHENIVGTFHVAEAAHAAGVRRLVFSSSASVYGEARDVPMTEEHAFDNRTMYGATKIAGEQILRALHAQHGLDYVALRYFNVYGPRMDDKGAYVSVIAKSLDRIRDGLPPFIHGDGSQAYDFIHVSDVARANLLALGSDVTDAAYNVATGVCTSISEVVAELLHLTGSSLVPEYQPEQRSLVTHRVGGTAAAARDLGFEARIPWREGLRDLVRWHEASGVAA
jgi:UDP-glucose 4-epimerase